MIPVFKKSLSGINFFHHYFLENFPGFKLKKPVFYLWDIALRFDLEKKLDKKTKHSLQRAFSLYDEIFRLQDNVMLVYQNIKRRKDKDIGFLRKNILNFDIKKKDLETFRNLYGEKNLWSRLVIESKAMDINHERILTAIFNTDFVGKNIRIEGEVYLINIKKKVIFHMYDDRGIDIISAQKKDLIKIYKKYKDWLLKYDKARMENIFE